MGSIKILVGGKCSKCGHPQQTHEENKGCTYPMPLTGNESVPCNCDSIGSY
jgi:hypothetical protein